VRVKERFVREATLMQTFRKSLGMLRLRPSTAPCHKNAENIRALSVTQTQRLRALYAYPDQLG